jgi:hypothetical protein
MSVCVYSVFVLLCVQVAVMGRANSPSKGPYRMCINLETEKLVNVHKGFGTIDMQIDPVSYNHSMPYTLS